MDIDQETLIQRANEEREEIFRKYERGRQGAVIDSWEDPGFEVYHKTDKYGFIHDERLPQRNTRDPGQSRIIEIQLEREKKWLKMIKKWNSKETKEKLHKRIYKGIPDKLRSRVWLKLLNVEKTMQDNKNVYSRMLKLARQWSTEARQIDSDVNRQFREHLFYRERYSVKQRSLFNVLTAYSMYNTEVGYCQGMAGVAGVLLMFMDEEEAFWALSTLLSNPKYAMHGLYVLGFPKLNRFLQHHDRIITRYLPRLKRHLDHYGLDAILYSLKWFFVIFIERIPFSLCLRVWDIYLMDGERVVTAMAYTILRLHSSRLLKMKEMDQIADFLQSQLHLDFGYPDDYVIRVLEKYMAELRRTKMDVPQQQPAPNEVPKLLGQFIEPDFDAKIGHRKSMFTDVEKEARDNVIHGQDSLVLNGIDGQSSYSYDGTIEDTTNSIKTWQSANSLATSTAGISIESLGSSSNRSSTSSSHQVTRL